MEDTFDIDSLSQPVDEIDALSKPAEGIQAGRGATVEDLRSVYAKSNPVVDFVQGFNSALADVLDAPGKVGQEFYDMIGVNKVVDKAMDATIGPAKSPRITAPSRETFVRAGIAPKQGQEPDTAAFAAGHMAGQNAPFLLAAPLFGPGVSAATGPGRGVVQGIFQDIGRTAVSAPATTATLELGTASLAGGSGHAAKEMFPDSEVAESLGQIIGGLAPAAMIGATFGAVNATTKLPLIGLVRRGATSYLRRIAEAATPKGASSRARDRMERAVLDQEAASRNLNDPNVLPEAKLTPAQKTRDPGLLALEKSVIDASDGLRVESDQQLAELNATIRESLEAPPEMVEATKQNIEASQEYLRRLIDGRLRLAGLEADRRISALEPGSTEVDANRIVVEELENALAAARATERELYSALPADAEVIPQATIQTFRSHLAERGPTADPEDIPAFLRPFLTKPEGDEPVPISGEGLADWVTDLLKAKGAKSEGDLYLGSGATFDDLRVLRSRILRGIREEEAKDAPNRNKIRIMGDIEDAILADLASVDDSDALRTALSYSRDLHERFSRGPAGRLLGSTRTGGPRVPAELALESTLGMGGPRAANNARELINSVRDAPEGVQMAASDFIKSKFLGKAVRNGRVDPTRAEAFLERNAALLNEFPQVRTDLQRAIESGQARDLIEMRAKRVGARLANPRISKATLFIQKDPDKAFDQIGASRDPAKEIQALINLTARDTTGEARQGLSAAFADWLLRSSMLRATDSSGTPFVSGAKLEAIVDKPAVKAMLERMLTPDQQKRMVQLVNTAKTLDAARSAKPSVEGIIADAPSVLVENLARIGALRMASKVSGGFETIQIPGMISNRVRDLVRSAVKDPAARLITDAITAEDDELFKALLSTADAPVPQAKVKRTINAWLAAVLFENGLPSQDIQQEQ